MRSSRDFPGKERRGGIWVDAKRSWSAEGMDGRENERNPGTKKRRKGKLLGARKK